MLTTPAGKPASWQIPAKSERGQRREFGWLQNHRVAGRQSGAIFHASISSGKFHGMICPTTPQGHVLGELLFEKLRPTRVVIEMPRHQRDIDVATLADGLAVVHRLENREQPRMFLHQPRDGIQVACARVGSECLPSRDAARAALTAASTSAAEPLRNRREFSPFEGSTVSKYSPARVPAIRRR
jgi:hypothetical protein